MDKIKNLLKQNKYQIILSTFSILVLSIILLLPIIIKNGIQGHDAEYHIGCIRAVYESLKQGCFDCRIFEQIGQDYGYGTGLFYSRVPSTICALLMYVFNLDVIASLVIEISLLLFLSGLVTFFFGKRIFKNNFKALAMALLYISFPYVLTNIFVRFAFSEMFITLALPLIAFGIYELLIDNNYKLFLLNFTLGYSLAIITHLSLTVYITIICAVFILLNWKKFISNYKWFTFLVSCGLVLLISATYYIPMLINNSVVYMDTMGRDGIYLFKTSYNIFYEPYLTISAILMLIGYCLYFYFYFATPKQERSELQKKFFILYTTSVVMNTAVFPWILVWIRPFTMIQFVWRLFSINALLTSISFVYSFPKIKLIAVKRLAVGVFALLLFANIYYDVNSYSYSHSLNEQYMSLNCYLSPNYANGGAKNGDYYVKGLTQGYLFNRGKEFITDKDDSHFKELANFQNQNVLQFVVENINEDYYTILKIPYSLCDNIQAHQYNYYSNNHYEVEINSINIDGQYYLKLEYKDYNNSTIVINYENNAQFKEYLQNNPFEFVVKSGNAEFSNFIKTNSHTYTVDAVISGDTTIELPTFAYKGYKVTLTNDSGVKELDATLGENGFLEITTNESGKISVEFVGSYVKVANIISIVGLILLVLVLLVVFIIPRKYFTQIADKITKLFKEKPILGEIVRFIIVGGIATIVDFLCMGVLMYLIQPSIYESFINVFINTPTPSTLATILGTSFGFICGLIVNYILSILFVFNEKGDSKTKKGFVVFTLLSVIGLGINVLGTFIGFDLLHINQWLVKIIMTIIVLIYNYISKKLILFKKKNTPVLVDTEYQTDITNDETESQTNDTNNNAKS